MQAPKTPVRRSVWLWASLALVVLAAAATLYYSLDLMPRHGYGGYLGFFALSSLVLLLAIGLFQKAAERINPTRALAVLILGALLLRLAALGAPAFLSDDIHRYVWDGRLIAAGHNPYATVPSQVMMDAPELFPLYEPLNSKDYFTVYPPISQAAFASGVWVAGACDILDEGRGIRLVFLLVDLLTVLLLARLIRKRGGSWAMAALYAWNPLVYWEATGAGHTEVLVLPWLVLMISATLDRRAWLVGLSLGLGALAKPTILVLAPILGWHLVRRRSWRAGLTAAGIAAATLVAGFSLFWYESLPANVGESLKLYNGYFAFNAPLYYGISWVLDAEVGAGAPLTWLGPTLGVGCFLFICAAAALQNGRDERLFGALTAAAGSYLLLSSVFHPWYLLIPLVCALLARSYSFVLLGFLIPISYLAYSPSFGETSAGMMAVQFGPFGLVLGYEAVKVVVHGALRFRARTKFRSFADTLRPGETILDLGAGEGYVAGYAEEQGHPVMLVDVADRNQTELPYEVYDGRLLPFSDASFDIGVLAYVLHHAREPDQVIEEAGRVCRRLVILESVYETQAQLELLTFLDQNVNLLRGLPKEKLHFRRVEDWERAFAKRGFVLEEGRWIGRGLHKQYLFRLRCAV